MRTTTSPDVEEFVARHWALAERLIAARRWGPSDVERDDTRSDGLLALWEAARTHDPSKGPEVAHVVRTVSWGLIDGHRKRNGRPDRGGRRLPPLQLDDDLSRVLVDRTDPIGARVDALAVHQVLVALPARHRDVLVARFLEDRALADIGRERGVSESRVCVQVRTALEAAARVAAGQSADMVRRGSAVCEDCGAPIVVKPRGARRRFCSSYHAARARARALTKPAPHPCRHGRGGAPSCVRGVGLPIRLDTSVQRAAH